MIERFLSFCLLRFGEAFIFALLILHFSDKNLEVRRELECVPTLFRNLVSALRVRYYVV